MDRTEMMNAIEAVLFAAGEPMTFNQIKKIFDRLWSEETDTGERAARLGELKEAYGELAARAQAGGDTRGFTLAQVAEGLTFRSNPRYAGVLRAMREEKPQRLSQAALETLAIVAYRQPVTKPEIDELRGVDCGATLRLLLERNLIRIVGKKEEPGRPMLYGTTREFLSFFNLGNLAQLPSLREFHELTPDSEEELKSFEEAHPNLRDLSERAKKLRLDEEPAVAALDEAMAQLEVTETETRAALEAEGIVVDGRNSVGGGGGRGAGSGGDGGSDGGGENAAPATNAPDLGPAGGDSRDAAERERRRSTDTT